METFAITKIRENNRRKAEDFLAEEVPFTLIANGKELVTLLCSPSNLEDLARGFLFTSGFIKRQNDIKNIIVDEGQWICYAETADNIGDDLTFKRLYTSGCGRGTLFYSAADIMHKSKIISNFKIKSAQVGSLMANFQKNSQVYLKTGGAHSAALADEKNILVFREDVGRHNAVDKVVGYMILKDNVFQDKILLTSGRVSSEVLFKARKCSIPVVISKSAPTNQAVKLSREMGITLVGFARGSRMNVYSCEERIVIQQ